MKVRSRSRQILRALALVLVFLQVLETPLLASGTSSFASVDLKNFSVPENIGLTRPASVGPNDLTILTIQDIHENSSAQEAVSALLEHLSTNYGLRTVGVEGAQGEVDLSLFRDFKDGEARKAAAEHMMKRGMLSGAELFAAAREQAVAVYGVDDNDLYWQNLRAFQDLLERKPDRLKTIDQLRSIVTALEDKVFSADLLALARGGVLRTRGAGTFTQRWQKIRDLAESRRVPLARFQTLLNLASAVDAGSRVNFEDAGRERGELLDALTRAVDPESLKALLGQAVEFKMGRASQGAFSTYLLNLAARFDLRTEAYPHLKEAADYFSGYEKIDFEDVRSESVALEALLREKLYASDEERKVQKLREKVELLGDLFEVRLAGEGLREIRSETFDGIGADLVQNLIALADVHGVRPPAAEQILGLTVQIPEAMQFYDLAEARNEHMLKNMTDRMRRDGMRVGVLVTGGFHARGMADIMKQDGISHVLILPRFATEASRPYWSLIAESPRTLRDHLNSEQSRSSKLEAAAVMTASSLHHEFQQKGKSAADAAPESLLQMAMSMLPETQGTGPSARPVEAPRAPIRLARASRAEHLSTASIAWNGIAESLQAVSSTTDASGAIVFRVQFETRTFDVTIDKKGEVTGVERTAVELQQEADAEAARIKANQKIVVEAVRRISGDSGRIWTNQEIYKAMTPGEREALGELIASWETTSGAFGVTQQADLEKTIASKDTTAPDRSAAQQQLRELLIVRMMRDEMVLERADAVTELIAKAIERSVKDDDSEEARIRLLTQYRSLGESGGLVTLPGETDRLPAATVKIAFDRKYAQGLAAVQRLEIRRDGLRNRLREKGLGALVRIELRSELNEVSASIAHEYAGMGLISKTEFEARHRRLIQLQTRQINRAKAVTQAPESFMNRLRLAAARARLGKAVLTDAALRGRMVEWMADQITYSGLPSQQAAQRAKFISDYERRLREEPFDAIQEFMRKRQSAQPATTQSAQEAARDFGVFQAFSVEAQAVLGDKWKPEKSGDLEAGLYAASGKETFLAPEGVYLTPTAYERTLNILAEADDQKVKELGAFMITELADTVMIAERNLDSIQRKSVIGVERAPNLAARTLEKRQSDARHQGEGAKRKLADFETPAADPALDKNKKKAQSVSKETNDLQSGKSSRIWFRKALKGETWAYGYRRAAGAVLFGVAFFLLIFSGEASAKVAAGTAQHLQESGFNQNRGAGSDIALRVAGTLGRVGFTSLGNRIARNALVYRIGRTVSRQTLEAIAQGKLERQDDLYGPMEEMSAMMFLSSLTEDPNGEIILDALMGADEIAPEIIQSEEFKTRMLQWMFSNGIDKPTSEETADAKLLVQSSRTDSDGKKIYDLNISQENTNGEERERIRGLVAAHDEMIVETMLQIRSIITREVVVDGVASRAVDLWRAEPAEGTVTVREKWEAAHRKVRDTIKQKLEAMGDQKHVAGTPEMIDFLTKEFNAFKEQSVDPKTGALKNGREDGVVALAWMLATFGLASGYTNSATGEAAGFKWDQQTMLGLFFARKSVGLAAGGGKTLVYPTFHALARLLAGSEYRGMIVVDNADGAANFAESKFRTGGQVGYNEYLGIFGMQMKNGSRMQMEHDTDGIIKALGDSQAIVVIGRTERAHLYNDSEENEELRYALNHLDVTLLDEMHQIVSFETALKSKGSRRADADRVNTAISFLADNYDFKTKSWKIGGIKEIKTYDTEYEFKRMILDKRGREEKDGEFVIHRYKDQIYLSDALEKKLLADNAHLKMNTKLLSSLIRAVSDANKEESAGGWGARQVTEDGRSRTVIVPISPDGSAQLSSIISDADYQTGLAMMHVLQHPSKFGLKPGFALNAEAASDAAREASAEKDRIAREEPAAPSQDAEPSFYGAVSDMVRMSDTSTQVATIDAMHTDVIQTAAGKRARIPLHNVFGATGTPQELEPTLEAVLGSEVVNINPSGNLLHDFYRLQRTNPSDTRSRAEWYADEIAASVRGSRDGKRRSALLVIYDDKLTLEVEAILKERGIHVDLIGTRTDRIESIVDSAGWLHDGGAGDRQLSRQNTRSFLTEQQTRYETLANIRRNEGSLKNEESNFLKIYEALRSSEQRSEAASTDSSYTMADLLQDTEISEGDAIKALSDPKNSENGLYWGAGRVIIFNQRGATGRDYKPRLGGIGMDLFHAEIASEKTDELLFNQTTRRNKRGVNDGNRFYFWDAGMQQSIDEHLKDILDENNSAQLRTEFLGQVDQSVKKIAAKGAARTPTDRWFEMAVLMLGDAKGRELLRGEIPFDGPNADIQINQILVRLNIPVKDRLAVKKMIREHLQDMRIVLFQRLKTVQQISKASRHIAQDAIRSRYVVEPIKLLLRQVRTGRDLEPWQKRLLANPSDRALLIQALEDRLTDALKRDGESANLRLPEADGQSTAAYIRSVSLSALTDARKQFESLKAAGGVVAAFTDAATRMGQIQTARDHIINGEWDSAGQTKSFSGALGVSEGEYSAILEETYRVSRELAMKRGISEIGRSGAEVMRFEEGELGEVVLNALTSDPSENQDEETQSPAALPTGKVDQQGDLTTSGATQNLSERSVKGRAKSGLLHRTFSIGSKIHKVLVGTLALNIACTDDECTQVTVTVDSDPGLTGRMRKVHTDSVGQPIRLYLVNVQQGDPSVNEGGITLRSEAMDLKIEPRMAFKDLAALMGVDLQQFVQVLKKRLQAKGLLKGDFMPEASLGDLALLLNTSPEVLRDEMVGAAAAIQIAKLIPKFEKIQKQFDKAAQANERDGTPIPSELVERNKAATAFFEQLQNEAAQSPEFAETLQAAHEIREAGTKVYKEASQKANDVLQSKIDKASDSQEARQWQGIRQALWAFLITNPDWAVAEGEGPSFLEQVIAATSPEEAALMINAKISAGLGEANAPESGPVGLIKILASPNADADHAARLARWVDRSSGGDASQQTAKWREALYLSQTWPGSDPGYQQAALEGAAAHLEARAAADPNGREAADLIAFESDIRLVDQASPGLVSDGIRTRLTTLRDTLSQMESAAQQQALTAVAKALHMEDKLPQEVLAALDQLLTVCEQQQDICLQQANQEAIQQLIQWSRELKADGLPVSLRDHGWAISGRLFRIGRLIGSLGGASVEGQNLIDLSRHMASMEYMAADHVERVMIPPDTSADPEEQIRALGIRAQNWAAGPLALFMSAERDRSNNMGDEAALLLSARLADPSGRLETAAAELIRSRYSPTAEGFKESFKNAGTELTALLREWSLGQENGLKLDTKFGVDIHERLAYFHLFYYREREGRNADGTPTGQPAAQQERKALEWNHTTKKVEEVEDSLGRVPSRDEYRIDIAPKDHHPNVAENTHDPMITMNQQKVAEWALGGVRGASQKLVLAELVLKDIEAYEKDPKLQEGAYTRLGNHGELTWKDPVGIKRDYPDGAIVIHEIASAVSTSGYSKFDLKRRQKLIGGFKKSAQKQMTELKLWKMAMTRDVGLLQEDFSEDGLELKASGWEKLQKYIKKWMIALEEHETQHFEDTQLGRQAFFQALAGGDSNKFQELNEIATHLRSIARGDVPIAVLLQIVTNISRGTSGIGYRNASVQILKRLAKALNKNEKASIKIPSNIDEPQAALEFALRLAEFSDAALKKAAEEAMRDYLGEMDALRFEGKGPEGQKEVLGRTSEKDMREMTEETVLAKADDEALTKIKALTEGRQPPDPEEIKKAESDLRNEMDQRLAHWDEDGSAPEAVAFFRSYHDSSEGMSKVRHWAFRMVQQGVSKAEVMAGFDRALVETRQDIIMGQLRASGVDLSEVSTPEERVEKFFEVSSLNAAEASLPEGCRALEADKVNPYFEEQAKQIRKDLKAAGWSEDVIALFPIDVVFSDERRSRVFLHPRALDQARIYTEGKLAKKGSTAALSDDYLPILYLKRADPNLGFVPQNLGRYLHYMLHEGLHQRTDIQNEGIREGIVEWLALAAVRSFGGGPGPDSKKLYDQLIRDYLSHTSPAYRKYMTMAADLEPSGGLRAMAMAQATGDLSFIGIWDGRQIGEFTFEETSSDTEGEGIQTTTNQPIETTTGDPASVPMVGLKLLKSEHVREWPSIKVFQDEMRLGTTGLPKGSFFKITPPDHTAVQPHWLVEEVIHGSDTASAEDWTLPERPLKVKGQPISLKMDEIRFSDQRNIEAAGADLFVLDGAAGSLVKSKGWFGFSDFIQGINGSSENYYAVVDNQSGEGIVGVARIRRQSDAIEQIEFLPFDDRSESWDAARLQSALAGPASLLPAHQESRPDAESVTRYTDQRVRQDAINVQVHHEMHVKIENGGITTVEQLNDFYETRVLELAKESFGPEAEVGFPAKNYQTKGDGMNPVPGNVIQWGSGNMIHGLHRGTLERGEVYSFDYDFAVKKPDGKWVTSDHKSIRFIGERELEKKVEDDSLSQLERDQASDKLKTRRLQLHLSRQAAMIQANVLYHTEDPQQALNAVRRFYRSHGIKDFSSNYGHHSLKPADTISESLHSGPEAIDPLTGRPLPFDWDADGHAHTTETFYGLKRVQDAKDPFIAFTIQVYKIDAEGKVTYELAAGEADVASGWSQKIKAAKKNDQLGARRDPNSPTLNQVEEQMRKQGYGFFLTPFIAVDKASEGDEKTSAAEGEDSFKNAKDQWAYGEDPEHNYAKVNGRVVRTTVRDWGVPLDRIKLVKPSVLPSINNIELTLPDPTAINLNSPSTAPEIEASQSIMPDLTAFSNSQALPAAGASPVLPGQGPASNDPELQRPVGGARLSSASLDGLDQAQRLELLSIIWPLLDRGPLTSLDDMDAQLDRALQSLRALRPFEVYNADESLEQQQGAITASLETWKEVVKKLKVISGAGSADDLRTEADAGLRGYAPDWLRALFAPEEWSTFTSRQRIASVQDAMQMRTILKMPEAGNGMVILPARILIGGDGRLDPGAVEYLKLLAQQKSQIGFYTRDGAEQSRVQGLLTGSLEVWVERIKAGNTLEDLKRQYDPNYLDPEQRKRMAVAGEADLFESWSSALMASEDSVVSEIKPVLIPAEIIGQPKTIVGPRLANLAAGMLVNPDIRIAQTGPDEFYREAVGQQQAAYQTVITAAKSQGLKIWKFPLPLLLREMLDRVVGSRLASALSA